MANFRHLMKNEGLQTVQRSFFEKKRKFTTFRRKKKVELAITRALVLLCHKCIVEFEKTLLLSGISSRIWVVAMFSYLGKTEKLPWFHNGKIRIKHWNILPALPLESFDWVLTGFCSFNFNLLEVSILFPLGNAKKVYWDFSGTIASCTFLNCELLLYHQGRRPAGL